MRVGAYEVTVVRDGRFRLDGGAMFGVVPKPLWKREHPADERNRIELSLNCLLVRGADRVLLVDTGMGHAFSEKEIDQYALERDDGDIVAALGRAGVAPDQVTDVILTHLHFDHAGGVVRGTGEAAELTFPKAMHWVQAQNLRWAQSPTERDRRSFQVHTHEVLTRHPDRVKVLEGPAEIAPGVRVFVVHGHTPGQQVVLIEGEEESGSVFFPGDLIPLASHLRIPYGMAYDLNPVITLSEKKEYLAQAVAVGWILAFDHDPRIVAATIGAAAGVFRIEREVEL